MLGAQRSNHGGWAPRVIAAVATVVAAVAAVVAAVVEVVVVAVAWLHSAA